MKKITAILNTYNEASLLKDCLNSLKDYVDEIIITDMKSQDKSREIAESYGSKVIIIDPAPIVEETIVQKIVLAKNNWILALDPDMRIPAVTWSKINEILNTEKYDVIVFFVSNKIFGTWLKYGHGSQCVSYRLFRKDIFLQNGLPKSRIHRLLVDNLKNARKYFMPRKYFIEHHAYSDINIMLEQHLRYAEVEAKELLANGRTSTLFGAFCLSIKKIIVDLIFRRGIFDGKYGIIYSVTAAMMILQREFIIISAGRIKKT